MEPKHYAEQVIGKQPTRILVREGTGCSVCTRLRKSFRISDFSVPRRTPNKSWVRAEGVLVARHLSSYSLVLQDPSESVFWTCSKGLPYLLKRVFGAHVGFSADEVFGVSFITETHSRIGHLGSMKPSLGSDNK